MACTSGFMVVLLPDRSNRMETGLTRFLLTPIWRKNFFKKKVIDLDLGDYMANVDFPLNDASPRSICIFSIS